MASMSRFAALSLAAATVVSFSTAGGAAPAYADPIPVPSLVDDGVYPGAAQILAEQNVRLIAGDGHIQIADCATPPVGDIGLLKVYTTDETIGADGIGRVCFKVSKNSGWLSLQVPGVYEIRGDGQRTGTGHTVTADLHSDDGVDITVDVDPDGSTQVGLGTDPNASPTMLLQLRAGDGLGPVTGANPAIGKLLTRGERMCTATLVSPQWILTAGSCFGDDGMHSMIAPGAPAAGAGVVFPGHGRTAVNWVVPRTGRDVALARLAAPIADITPIALATATAPMGTALPAVGYGRTATDWETDAQQSPQITFTAYNLTSLSASSGPLVCKGMAGSPVLHNGKIAGVLSQAGQTGCFDAVGSGSAVTAARTDDLATWLSLISTTTADHTWSLADMPPGGPGAPVYSAEDEVYTGSPVSLTATAGTTWNTGDTFSPSVTFDGSNASLAATGPAVATEGSFTVSAWVKPDAAGGTVLSQDAVNTTAFSLSTSGSAWAFTMSSSDEYIALQTTASASANTVKVGQWAHVTATFNAAKGTMKLYVDGVEVAVGKRSAAFASTGPFRIGGSSTRTHFAGRIAGVQTWNRVVVPEQTPTPAGYYQKLAAPTRFLDTRNGTGGTTGPVARNGVVHLKIAGANGIPATGVTAVALSLATILPADNGNVTVWPDLGPQPWASSLAYNANVVTSGYMIVPVSSNGYIAISPWKRSLYRPFPPPDTSTHIIADVSGYFTSDSAASGIGSYTPVVPVRFADSRTGAGGHSGQIPANTTWDYTVTGVAVDSGTIPNGITAVAVNVTAVGSSGSGYVNTWQQGQPIPVASGLQFQPTDPYANMAIIPVNPATGKFSLRASQPAHLVIEILGYFAPGTSGQKYHGFPSTGLFDSVNGDGTVVNGAGAIVAPPGAMTGPNITLVLGISASADSNGYVRAYPTSTTIPVASTLNYVGGRPVSNGAIVKTGTGGTVTVGVTGATASLAIACNGYFGDA